MLYCRRTFKPQVFNDWYKLTGLKLREGFGQTEGTVLIANFKWMEPSAGSTGKPSPLYDIRLINNDGNDCKPGEEGTIVIYGVNKKLPIGLFTGYYHNPELTDKALAGNIMTPAIWLCVMKTDIIGLWAEMMM